MPVSRHRSWRPATWTVILITFGLLTLVAYQGLSYEHPIGTGPAGPQVAVEPFAMPWSTRRVVLLTLGDSVTAGYGSTPGHSYVDLLTRPPANDDPALTGCSLARVFPELTVVRKAISGSTSFDLWSQIPRRPYDADILGVVVMTSGGNDLIHNYGRTPPSERAMYGATWEQAQPWLPGYTARLEDALARLEKLFPGGFQLFLATIYDPTDGIGDIASAGLPPWPDGLKLLAAYNQRILAFAAAHPLVHVVDMRSLFLGHGIHCTDATNAAYHADDPHYWYFRNLEDPNDRGYDALRRLFLTGMATVLAPRP
jgi:lysophospholipase L1-like esterase